MRSDGVFEAQLLTGLLRGGAGTDQQLACSQDVPNERRQRQDVHIPMVLDRLAQLLRTQHQHRKRAKGFSAANLPHQRLQLVVVKPRRNHDDFRTRRLYQKRRSFGRRTRRDSPASALEPVHQRLQALGIRIDDEGCVRARHDDVTGLPT